MTLFCIGLSCLEGIGRASSLAHAYSVLIVDVSFNFCHVVVVRKGSKYIVPGRGHGNVQEACEQFIQ